MYKYLQLAGDYMMKKRVFLVGKKTLQLIRLIGSFTFFGAIIMMLYSTALMFEQWDAIKKHTECLSSAEFSTSYCNEQIYKTTGIYPAEFNGMLSLKQKFIIIVRPLAQLFFWAVVFFFGTMLYNCRRLSFPIQEIEAGHGKR